MAKKAILFDLDGTLVNSLPDISRSMNTALEMHGLPGHPENDYRLMVGNGAVKLAERACGPDHADLAQAVFKDYAAIYSGHSRVNSYAYPGVLELLKSAKALGLKLVVLSNKDDKDVPAVLEHFFGKGIFDVMRGKRPGVPLKPDPAAAVMIAEELGIAPADFWYMGDTATDCKTCQGAGMEMIAVTYGFRLREELEAAGAAHIAASPEEALAIIQKG